MRRVADNLASDKYLSDFLELFPVLHALPRALEAKLLSTLSIRSPSLDIGCGDGVFAGILMQGKPWAIDIGIDTSQRELGRAIKSNAYASVVRSDTRDLPFADGTFNTIISNSVLEHVPRLGMALAEISRVLAPRGNLAFTVPLEDCSNSFFYSNLLNMIGLPRMADLYVSAKHKMWRHVNLMNRDGWEAKLDDAGLTVRSFELFNQASVVRLCDIIGPLSFPSLVAQRMFDRNTTFRPKWTVPALVRMLEKYYWAESETGGAAFVTAMRS